MQKDKPFLCPHLLGSGRPIEIPGSQEWFSGVAARTVTFYSAAFRPVLVVAALWLHLYLDRRTTKVVP